MSKYLGMSKSNKNGHTKGLWKELYSFFDSILLSVFVLQLKKKGVLSTLDRYPTTVFIVSISSKCSQLPLSLLIIIII